MGSQKYKNGQISVGHFCGKRAMGAKTLQTETVQNIFVGLCFFFVATYGNEVISVGGHRKKHRPSELFTPFEAMYKTCL